MYVCVCVMMYYRSTTRVFPTRLFSISLNIYVREARVSSSTSTESLRSPVRIPAAVVVPPVRRSRVFPEGTSYT